MSGMREWSVAVALLPLLAMVADAQTFDLVSTEWATIYTALSNKPIKVKAAPHTSGNFRCKQPYALCSNAYCLVVNGSKPLVAACGCIPYLSKQAMSQGRTAADLSQHYRDEDLKLCLSGKVDCWDLNTANFCMGMKRNDSGIAAMYGEPFELISTFNPHDWVGPTAPDERGCGTTKYANCYAAACLVQPSFNGFGATCYCPVFTNSVKGCSNPCPIVSNATGTYVRQADAAAAEQSCKG